MKLIPTLLICSAFAVNGGILGKHHHHHHHHHRAENATLAVCYDTLVSGYEDCKDSCDCGDCTAPAPMDNSTLECMETCINCLGTASFEYSECEFFCEHPEEPQLDSVPEEEEHVMNALVNREVFEDRNLNDPSIFSDMSSFFMETFGKTMKSDPISLRKHHHHHYDNSTIHCYNEFVTLITDTCAENCTSCLECDDPNSEHSYPCVHTCNDCVEGTQIWLLECYEQCLGSLDDDEVWGEDDDDTTNDDVSAVYESVV